MKNEKPLILLFRFFVLIFPLGIFSCRFQSAHVSYLLPPGVTYGLRYGAELEAVSKGASHAYASSAEARFSFKAASDSGKVAADSSKSFELVFTVDSLAFQGADRDSGEDRYMADRLRKYRARLLLSSAGQVLALEEEPALPPVGVSTLDFGRRLLYGLPVFPAEDIGKGSQWTAEQPLLDKFHPGSKVVKSFTVTSLRKTGEGRILTADMTLDVRLEDLDGEAGQGPALTGKGEAVFNLDKGRPLSINLLLQGDFQIPSGTPATDTTPAPASKPLHLKERLRLDFQG
jgi:hypothetical protein